MLVLTRRRGERIIIARDITITVIETRSGKVRLGISAPQGMPIHREEVFERLTLADGWRPLAECCEVTPVGAESN